MRLHFGRVRRLAQGAGPPRERAEQLLALEGPGRIEADRLHASDARMRKVNAQPTEARVAGQMSLARRNKLSGRTCSAKLSTSLGISLSGLSAANMDNLSGTH